MTTTRNLPALVLATVIPGITIVGLIVLVALGKVTWADVGPLIAVLAGVHGGGVIADGVNKAAVTPVSVNVNQPPHPPPPAPQEPAQTPTDPTTPQGPNV